MTAEESIYSYLAGYTTFVQATLSESTGHVDLVGTRIYPRKLPDQPILPSVSYTQVSYVPTRVLDPGVVLITARYQFSCWGVTYASAKRVAAQLVTALQDFAGQMGGAGGIQVRDATVVHIGDVFDHSARLHEAPVDVMLQYTGGD